MVGLFLCPSPSKFAPQGAFLLPSGMAQKPSKVSLTLLETFSPLSGHHGLLNMAGFQKTKKCQTDSEPCQFFLPD
jgi:hypothetical protein